MPSFHSILIERTEDRIKEEIVEAPAFFVDLNLDQIVDSITASKPTYNLMPFFYTPLKDVETVHYRHEVFRDLQNKSVFKPIESFAHGMAHMRERLTLPGKLYHKLQKERWFLEAVQLYCSAVQRLTEDLSEAELGSRGLLAFRQYLAQYVHSDAFTSVVAETDQIIADLATVQYSVLIRGNAVKVRRFESARDYSTEVLETFKKFQQGEVKDYRVKFTEFPDMNGVEERILDGVAALYPDLFARLDAYCTNHADYLDETIARFDREIQFYVAYLDYTGGFKHAQLAFCYPAVSSSSKQIYAQQAFDLALAAKLLRERSAPPENAGSPTVVSNDFYLEDPERIILVSGPNQGGKTTFARMFGQLHYLAALGCPVPGREAQLILFDQLFTHFEKEEDIQDLRGKLEDDLVRIHSILDQATSNSVLIMNEIFTSTTVQDALFLGKEILERIIQLDALCVFVTFLDELASLSDKTVSMVSTVVPENPALRTFKIVRQPADGLAYALAIADKYHVTYKDLKERLHA